MLLVEYFLKLTHASAEPACLLTLQGDILAFNPSMAQLTGRKHHMAKGLPFTDFLAAKNETLSVYLQTAAGSTEAVPGLVKILDHEKRAIDCHCHTSLIFSKHDDDQPCLLMRLNIPHLQDNIFTLLNAELETLRHKHHELRKQKAQLNNYIKERTQRLSQEIRERKAAQKTLLQAEKMAALGSLVSGVAHEINTPIGVGVTGASHMEDITRHFKRLFNDNLMKKSDLTEFLNECEQTSRIIHSNLQRASELILSFKQVAVDQSSEERRKFNIKLYIDDILLSLYPTLKKTAHQITFHCPDNLEVNSYPGAFSQILTNLIMNSMTHGFEDMEAGSITINVFTEDHHYHLIYQDNGKGMTEEQREKIFDPFFTTKRGKGGSGLGMHVVYNLVCEKLAGTIDCSSRPGQGVLFDISIPLN